MAPRTIRATPEQWGVVGTAVRSRRYALGLKPEDLGSASVVSNLENGHPLNGAITERTAVRICTALGWTTTSIQRLIRGWPPLPVDGMEANVLADHERRIAALEESLERALSSDSDRQAPPTAGRSRGRSPGA